MKKIKKICIASAESREIIGSNEIRNTTFFTRKEFANILFVPEVKPSAKKNHGNIPAMSHKIKGKLSIGCDLNPTWNTNQKISTVAVGCINAHSIPRKLPIYFCLKSFLVNSINNFLF